MKKKLLAFIITCVMITGVISTNYMNSHALAAGATYTAYEIISMIFAVVGGTTINQTQGLVGSSSFNANSLYETMNTQSSGIGSLLSSYVNRAQYLSPGSDLIMSDADYQEFLEYFRQYNLQNSVSGEITSESERSFIDNLEAFYGITLPNTIPYDMKQKINNGTFLYAIRVENEGATLFPTDRIGYYIAPTYTQSQYQDLWYNLVFSQNCYVYDGTQWVPYNSQRVVNYLSSDDIKINRILGGVGYKSDTIANQKIKNGTYDTVSKSRTWDATQGKLVGNTTITMPATETLDEAIKAENVKNITDAVNVYPVDTANDSMIYYPSQSVVDFVVPSITINPSIAFPGVDGSISDYTVTLTDFFPFCIPWDIYDMLSAFVTTPETPEFTFQFPTGVINHQIQWTECTFDLHAWDGVASAVRTIELISFAIGLGLMTRNIFLRG